MLGVPGGAAIYHCIVRRLSPPDKIRVVVERYRFFGKDDPRNHISRVMCEIMCQNIMIAVLVSHEVVVISFRCHHGLTV